jgi:hypothetical protein
MNIHTDAGLTYAHRLELVMDILERDLALCAAATACNASVPTARKWAGRYLAEGEAGLRDRSSRSKRSPRAITPSKAPPAIVELRCRRLVQRRIAASVGVSKSAVGRVLTRAGLSRLRDLEPCALVVRYGHPGDLAHIDTKKLGRIERIDHRIIGDRRDTVDGAGCGSCSPPSTTTRESASPTFTPISARRARCSSRRTPRATSPRLGCASIACSPTTARRFAPRRSPSLARALGLKHSFTRPDDRQGGTLHPVGAARVGLRHRLQPFHEARRHAQALDASLQLASSAPGDQRSCAKQPLGPVQKRPLDASHSALR